MHNYNYFLIGVSSFHFIDGVEHFSKKFQTDPTFWTAHPKKIEALREKFPDTILMNAHDLTCADTKALSNVIGVNKLDLEPMSPDFHEKFAKEKLLVQENLLHRSDPWLENFTHSEIRDTVNNYFVIAYNLIKKYTPSLILYEVAPHTMYDLALYQLAQKKGIKNVMLMDTNIPSISFATNDFSNNKKLIGLPHQDQALREKAVDIYEEHTTIQKEAVPFYMRRNKFSRSYPEMIYGLLQCLYETLKKLYSRFKKIFFNLGKSQNEKKGYEKVHGYMLHEKTGNLFSKLKKYWLGVTLESFYQGKTDGFTLEGHDPYIYIPLSMQHERTTMPAARFMYDQKAYIKLLANHLPPDFTLIVKENPKQFSYIRGARTRDKRFYKDLEDLGVKFAPLDFSSHELTQHSAAVAVTTGSAGFEAVVGHNKPVLKFANSWYQELPGIYEIKTGNDLKTFFEKLEKGKCAINKGELNNYLQELRKYVVYLYPAGITVKTEAWNANAMAENISLLLKNELGLTEHV